MSNFDSMGLSEKMSHLEWKATTGLAGLYACRLIGLFMILPVFAIYLSQFPGITTWTFGLAMSIYGLTQALLQIPFGMLSDKIGRKPIITLGLIIFILGSSIAALSHSITWLIIGRALQGAGAIGSTVNALTADLTREQQRSKAMAIIGMSIGAAFFIAMLLGPLLNAFISIPGIFWCAALFGVIALFILHGIIPSPHNSCFHRDMEVEPVQIQQVLKNTELLRLNIGIFTLHTILMASFVAIPLCLTQHIGFNSQQLWMLYLPVLLLAFIASIPFLLLAERKQCLKPLFLTAIACIVIAQIGLLLKHDSLISLILNLLLFFTAFTFLEANLPSLLTRIAPPASKGTASGIYSTAQFLGIFIAGPLSAFLRDQFDLSAIFIANAALSAIWLFLAYRMVKPKQLSNILLRFDHITTEQAQQYGRQLGAIAGIIEANVFADDGIAYLKVDRRQLDQESLHNFYSSAIHS